MPEVIMLVLYALIGAIAGMIYGLKKIFILEYKIDQLDKRIVRALNQATTKRKKK